MRAHAQQLPRLRKVEGRPEPSPSLPTHTASNAIISLWVKPIDNTPLPPLVTPILERAPFERRNRPPLRRPPNSPCLPLSRDPRGTSSSTSLERIFLDRRREISYRHGPSDPPRSGELPPLRGAPHPFNPRQRHPPKTRTRQPMPSSSNWPRKARRRYSMKPPPMAG